ncbi:putative bifunctional diguanylate cyclase/phosphodiesterase [Rhizobium tubonense]|uniref:GGDEF-domain containing protein n=1 Tax=Rhizobium tubonense TaxID=484088 RepID=A0A2W4EJH3_9HYPH|nr:EAL domain-containing protein [Rhizobium tubonense]PZM11160.1 GGDEF-domain containing protein [Rhizobium tubonense]
MHDFFRSRAGKQLLVLLGVGVSLWTLGFELRFHENLLHFIMAFRSADAIFLAVRVAGAMSIVYSALRIYDLRKEMDIRSTAEARADWIATHDQLTKLPNRYAFERTKISVGQAGEQDIATITLFSVDLDDFKKVNDLVGHKGGDALLVEVSRRLGAFADPSCVYRFGGDEFIIIARGLTLAKEDAFSRMIVQAITRPIMIGNFVAEVGASVGYARLPDHGQTLDDVAHCSDVAMYEAKSTGPNHSFAFNPAMQHKVTESARFEAKLRSAIEAGTIRPHYQPLIDLRTGHICGFEALARWVDEDGVSVPPLNFIGVAEETGLITDLFKQLLAQACRDARSWPEELILSFNVSPVQMEDRLLASRILKILEDADLPPQRLEIEITENALIGDPDMAALIIEDLHQAGVQIALDDFGTGYSSLAQLARYKFDKIKIDKSFVATYGSDERQEKIVRAMLGLGRSLNIKTTAEGIEEHSQLSYLLSHGCDIGQGYLFGKAMPAEEALGFIYDRDAILSA